MTENAAQCSELEGALTLLLSDVRQYRDEEQKRMSDPMITISELMRAVGAFTALKNVEKVVGMIAELYKVNPENGGKTAAEAHEEARGRAGVHP